MDELFDLGLDNQTTAGGVSYCLLFLSIPWLKEIHCKSLACILFILFYNTNKIAHKKWNTQKLQAVGIIFKQNDGQHKELILQPVKVSYTVENQITFLGISILFVVVVAACVLT